MAFRRGQAMVETLLAVLLVTSLFLCLFKLSHRLTGKILLEHAAMRVARARAVGYNDFMCKKVARVAVIPVAGERLTPTTLVSERATAEKYLQTPNGGLARGLLHYAGWDEFTFSTEVDGTVKTHLTDDWFDLKGQATVTSEFPLYMEDQGL